MRFLVEQLHSNVATLIDAIEQELGRKMKKGNYKTTIDTLNKITATLLQLNKIEQLNKETQHISDQEDARIIEEFLKTRGGVHGD